MIRIFPLFSAHRPGYPLEAVNAQKTKRCRFSPGMSIWTMPGSGPGALHCPSQGRHRFLYRIRDRGRELCETSVLCQVRMDPKVFPFRPWKRSLPRGQTRSRESAGLSAAFSVILYSATSMDFLFLSLSIFNRDKGKWGTAFTKKASFSWFTKINS